VDKYVNLTVKRIVPGDYTPEDVPEIIKRGFTTLLGMQL
jgi:hypothetical protein